MKSGGNGGARFDILIDLEEDLDVVGNPMNSGLKGNQGVVDGVGKDSSAAKEKFWRVFNNRMHVGTEKETVDRTHHR